MNDYLIQLNSNQGISIDQLGNFSNICKEKEAVGFKEILKKENDLEELENELSEKQKKWDSAFNKLRFLKIYDLSLVIAAIMLGIISYVGASAAIWELLKCIGIITFVAWLIPVGRCGTITGNKRRLRKLNHRIFQLENKVPKLRKELSDIKEKVNYSVLSTNALNNEQQELIIDFKKNANEEGNNLGKIKVLRLKKEEKR